MMKKAHRQEGSERQAGRKRADAGFQPRATVAPGSNAGIQGKTQRPTETARRREGEISTLRQLLGNQDFTGHWEVPG